MTPTDEFQGDAAKREKLAKLLRDPVLKEALNALRDEMEPRDDLAVTLANPTVAAHRYHHIAGANHIIKGLTALTLPKAPVKTPPKGRTQLRQNPEAP